MMLFGIGLFGLVLSVISFFVFGIWGFPVVLLTVLVIVGYLAAAKKENPELGTVERARGPEPTGQPRMSHGSAETANQRQGQL